MRKLMIKRGLFFLVFISLFVACNCDLRTDFQDLAAGIQHNLGNTFNSNGLDFTLIPFIWSNTNPSPSGFVRVENQGAGQAGAGGTGHNLNVNNVNVQFNLPQAAKKMSMDVGYWGGNMNLKINGDFRNFTSISAINATVVGGVTVTASGAKDQPGIWKFDGLIDSFEIGGQELYIDNICVSY